MTITDALQTVFDQNARRIAQINAELGRLADRAQALRDEKTLLQAQNAKITTFEQANP